MRQLPLRVIALVGIAFMIWVSVADARQHGVVVLQDPQALVPSVLFLIACCRLLMLRRWAAIMTCLFGWLVVWIACFEVGSPAPGAVEQPVWSYLIGGAIFAIAATAMTARSWRDLRTGA
jgi:hypothetical protein